MKTLVLQSELLHLVKNTSYNYLHMLELKVLTHWAAQPSSRVMDDGWSISLLPTESQPRIHILSRMAKKWTVALTDLPTVIPNGTVHACDLLRILDSFPRNVLAHKPEFERDGCTVFSLSSQAQLREPRLLAGNFGIFHAF
jgi:hypothetical protein